MRYFNGESELRMAMRHVQEGHACIARQLKLIAKLRERGQPTQRAEEVLLWMEEIQRTFEEDYETVRQKAMMSLTQAGLQVPPSTPEPKPDCHGGQRLKLS